MLVILLTCLSLTSFNHRQGLEVIHVNRLYLRVKLHLPLRLTTHDGSFNRRSILVFAGEAPHALVHFGLVQLVLDLGFRGILFVVLLDLLECRSEQLANRLLL